MVGRLPAAVAALAIRRPNRLVVESYLRPVGGVVAGRTLTAIMIGWFPGAVAAFAVCCPYRLVVETRL